MVIAEFGMAISVYAFWGKFDASLIKFWNNAAVSDKQNVQNLLTCCGFASFKDNAALPCPSAATQGCQAVAKADMTHYMHFVGPSLITFAFFEIAGLVASCFLMKKINHTYAYEIDI